MRPVEIFGLWFSSGNSASRDIGVHRNTIKNWLGTGKYGAMYVNKERVKMNKKTLVIILHYNTLEITGKLYHTLKPYEKDIYDLIVIDNASDPDKRFPNAEVLCKKNTYFGGGLARGFRYFREHKAQYDSLLFMNSDLVVFGKAFVSTLRDALRYNPEYKIISPVLISDWNGQPPLMMHQHMCHWGAGEIREVKYIDFECPMFHEDFVNQIDYPRCLTYGIGQDLLAGKYCEDRGWKIGVVDWMTAFHYWAYTIRSGNGQIDLNTFAHVSNESLNQYAKKNNLEQHIKECFEYGRTYAYTED